MQKTKIILNKNKSCALYILLNIILLYIYIHIQYYNILYADITVLIRSTGLQFRPHLPPHRRFILLYMFIFYSYLYGIIYYYIATGKRPTGCPLTRVSCLSKNATAPHPPPAVVSLQSGPPHHRCCVHTIHLYNIIKYRTRSLLSPPPRLGGKFSYQFSRYCQYSECPSLVHIYI